MATRSDLAVREQREGCDGEKGGDKIVAKEREDLKKN